MKDKVSDPKKLELFVVVRRMAMQRRDVIIKVCKTFEQAQRARWKHKVQHRVSVVRFVEERTFSGDHRL